MMGGEELLQLLQERHSVRNYTGEQVPMEKLNAIIEAGLLAPSSRGARSWEFIVVRNKEKLINLSSCRMGGTARMLVGADAAIAVLANEEISDVWAEDCAVVMTQMHLMAAALGVGSCWIQARERQAMNGQTTEEYVREILKFPSEYRLGAILSMGMPEVKMPPTPLEILPFEKVHINAF